MWVHTHIYTYIDTHRSHTKNNYVDVYTCGYIYNMFVCVYVYMCVYTGIACFSRVRLTPFCFYERPTLIPTFGNNSEKDFCVHEERQRAKTAFSVGFAWDGMGGVGQFLFTEPQIRHVCSSMSVFYLTIERFFVLVRALGGLVCLQGK